ncbi:MAG TPA: glycosyl hydrolase, partial [Tepidisphaeraceae bacterium]|nr:glycosyl hydrolase [Tepidisphaeraceae bacterium]
AYWQQVVEPLLADAGTMCGKTLTRLQTDSWEMGLCNWTDDFAEQFRSRRGYEITPYIAALAGKIVGSRDVTNRFLYDFRKTVGDCIADDHYRAFAERAHARGLGIQCESGGPHGAPIDALKCLGRDDMPMGEFWAPSNQHRVKPQERFFMKQSASSAHIYGHPRACGEGFTSIGPHWEETPWSLKTAFDTEACEGLNLIYWHAFVCSPAETGMPGQQYFAGSHLNPKVTWWNDAGAFMSYMNRCQYLLQQGLFVADAVYYYGDSVPNFARLKSSDPAHVLPGRDYDVCDEEVLLTRMSVKGARIVLPDGMTYRVLVLPDRQSMPPAVLAKIAELVKAGATVIGPKPTAAAGLADYPQCDAKVAALADEVWGTCDGKTITENRYGQGRVVWGKTAKQVLEADGVPMDFATEAKLDYIHRAGADGDIYFITNPADVPVDTTCTFRVSAKAAQMWWPDYGKIHRAAMTSGNGTAAMPLHLNGRGSMFVVFGAAADGPPQSLAVDSTSAPPIEINGLWTVHFEPGWGAPESIAFPKLISWTDNADPNIKFFSGTATYSVDVGVPAGDHDWVLDLGEVDDLARVKVNGTDVGVVWEKPARIDVSGAWRPGRNTIEIAVTNLWPNRLIGDAGLPPEQRRTRTNIRKFTGKSPLRPSGLLGPVRLIPQAAQQETTQ